MTQQCAMLAKEQPGVIDPSGRQKSQCGEGASEVFHFLFQVKGALCKLSGISMGHAFHRDFFLTHFFMWHKMSFSE